MIVVSDTSPICYLLLIGEIELLPQLYGEVLIPKIVQQELSDARAPVSVDSVPLAAVLKRKGTKV